MKRTTLIKTPFYGLISALLAFLAWCSINYEIRSAEGYVTDIFTTTSQGEVLTMSQFDNIRIEGDETQIYQYFVRVEDGLLECDVDQEGHIEINGLKHLNVVYDHYPTGEMNCLYLGY